MDTQGTATETRETTFSRPSDREIRATHVTDAPIELVWEAHTDCAHLAAWQLGPDGWVMTH